MVSMSDVNDPEPLPKAGPPPARAPAPTEPPPVRTPAHKDINGDELIVAVLASGPATWGELRNAFVNRDFAPASVGTYLARALKAGKIVRGGYGRYSLSSAGNGRGAS